MSTIKQQRLHIGAKNLIDIPKVSWGVLSQESWIHLGEEKPDITSIKKPQIQIKKSKKQRFRGMVRKIIYALRHAPCALRTVIGEVGERKEQFPLANDINQIDLSIVEKSKIMPWYYKKGDVLPFQDHTFTFVYSEHFFEHLFLDEALSIFKEIFRTMKRGAVCRTVVPDADLRVYESPEPPGYPGDSISWDHPEKHKTRWSYTVLREVLDIAGFEKIMGLVYCTLDGKFINKTPVQFQMDYAGCIDTDVVFDMSY
ncbi:MAG: methyltransferase domain-containing protein, partial [Candidatus Scalindua sp.]